MKPVLVACYFGDGYEGLWPRMARVLAYTAAQHCPGWDVRVDPITPAPLRSAIGVESLVWNTQKMEHWAAAVEALPDGARVLLIDADTFIVRPLDDVWDEPFDFGYTTKVSRFPFNSGVVFLRVTPAVRAFMRVWRAENLRMLGDRLHHQEWRAKFGGINQAALGYALTTHLTDGLRMRQLPCAEWNCEDTCWRSFNPAVTRIVHVKSLLRRFIFNMGPPAPHLRALKRYWLALETAAGARLAHPA